MAYLRLRLPQAETARPRLFQELLNPEFPENTRINWMAVVFEVR